MSTNFVSFSYFSEFLFRENDTQLKYRKTYVDLLNNNKRFIFLINANRFFSVITDAL